MPKSTAVFLPRQRVISETGLIAVNSTFATFDRQKLEIVLNRFGNQCADAS